MTPALGSAPTARRAGPSGPARLDPRARRRRWARTGRWSGWLYVLPALLMYGLFVLRPLALTFQYSLYHWNGIGVARWAGFDNYVTVFTDRDLLKIIGNALVLIVFFSFIPVGLGLLVASLVRRITGGPFGTAVWTWNQFLLAIVLVDDSTKRTMAGALGAFQGQWGTDQVLLCAGSLLILTPTLIVFLIFHRQFIKAMLQGSVKG